MSDELEINCPICLKCGQRKQDTMIISTLKSYAICKCKNPNCIRNCIREKQTSVISGKKCPRCGYVQQTV